jgi:hypothetical protein
MIPGWVGNAWLAVARWKAGRKEDASAEYRSALEAFEEAVRLNPGLARALRETMEECRAGK